MTGAAIAFAAAGCGVGWFLTPRAPLSLDGTVRRRYFAALCAVNAWVCAAGLLRQRGVWTQGGWTVLANLLAYMSITDLREQAVYDIHSSAFLLAGAVCAFFQLGAGFWSRILTAAVIFGALWLAARKKTGLGGGDLRVIAALALCFPLAKWTEAVLLSLLLTMLCGFAVMFRRKGTLETELPFMPFLLAGMLAEITARDL